MPCDVAKPSGDRLLISGGTLVNVFSGETYPADVLCQGNLITAIGCPGALAGPANPRTQVVDARGCYLVPGLINGHLHVESSLITPDVYGRTVLTRGTTTLVPDPHEIANVLGLPGIEALMALGERSPADFFWTAPSCVPASPLETAGADLGPAEVAQLLADPRVVALGEMMNYPGVINSDPEVLAKLAAARAAGKPVDGHGPRLSGRDLDAYVTAGVRSDHEAINIAEGRAKIRRGMWLMVREGSAAQNLATLLPLAQAMQGERMMLVTDDRHPDDLLSQGELDQSLRQAVAGGLDPMAAIRMTTYNPACYFGLTDRGLIAPGRIADIWLVEDLVDFATRAVIKSGSIVWPEALASCDPARAAQCAAPPELPGLATANTVQLPPNLDILLSWPAARGQARVIGVRPDQIITDCLVWDVSVDVDGRATSSSGDLCLIAVVERHGRTGGAGLGFASGFGLRRGAIGSTVAHDSHNLILAGTNPQDMIAAAQALAGCGGGFVVVEDGEVTALLPLPVAGLMSSQPLAALSHELAAINEAIRRLGCQLHSPLMTLSFMALPVVPEVKLTDRGLVDVSSFTHVPLWV